MLSSSFLSSGSLLHLGVVMGRVTEGSVAEETAWEFSLMSLMSSFRRSFEGWARRRKSRRGNKCIPIVPEEKPTYKTNFTRG